MLLDNKNKVRFIHKSQATFWAEMRVTATSIVQLNGEVDNIIGRIGNIKQRHVTTQKLTVLYACGQWRFDMF